MTAPLSALPHAPDRYTQKDEDEFRLALERQLQELRRSIPGKASTGSVTLTSGSNNNLDVGTNITIVRLTPDAGGSTITGIVAQKGERTLKLINLGSADIILSHDSASSTAENRFLNSTGADVTLEADQLAELTYDAASLRWRVVGPAPTVVLKEWVSDFYFSGTITVDGSTVTLNLWDGASPNTDYKVPAAGSIVGVSVQLLNARTANSFVAEVYLNNSATGLQAIIDGTNTLQKTTTQAAGLDTIAAGDVIQVRYTATGFTPTTQQVWAQVQIQWT